MKLSPYDFSSISPDLENFRDEFSNLWNYGKYQTPVVKTPPTWVGQIGEQVFYRPTSGGTTNYFFAGTAWVSSWSVTL